MPSHDRRAAARRRAWGRGPIILRFEPLEGRQLLAARPLPDLVSDHIATSTQSAQWGDSLDVSGDILNQGRGAAPKSFDVEILASSSPKIQPGNAVILGDFTVASGLGPKQSVAYNQRVTLPPTPIPGFAGKPIFIATYIAPGHAVAESNYRNNYSVGLGLDTASLTIVAAQPSQLVGTSFQTSTQATAWGQQITVSAQIANEAQGNAVATRAPILLTPNGVTPGTGEDFFVGYLNVPAVAAWQTVNLVQTFTLPPTAPAILGTGSQFTISMAQDGDYLADPMYPHVPAQGTGRDSGPLTIGPGAVSSTSTTPAPLPDLAAGTVQAPSTTLHWGQGFPVTATVQNLGQGVAGPFNVVFVMTGSSTTISPAIFLGQSTVSGLAAGASQTITANLLLPSRLPSSVALNSGGTGRIAMLVDPENVVNESTISNNISFSNPVGLRLLGADGTTTVPTTAPPTVTLGTPQPQGSLTPAGTGTGSAKLTPAEAARQAKAQAREYRQLHLRATPKKPSLTSKVEHKLKVFPKQLSNAFTNLFK